MAVKHIDIGEFRELGFLQEANRLFFHPHGLALEITRVTADEGAPITAVAFTGPEMVALRRILAWADPGEAEAVALIEARLDAGAVYEVDDCWLSGVWDYRDDPEGVVMGDWDDEKWAAMAEAVRAERARHYFERAKMFGSDPQHRGAPQYAAAADIEPVGWKPTPKQIAAWEKQREEANADA